MAPSYQTHLYLLNNLDCAAAFKPSIVTILANSNNEFQLSMMEVLLITRHKPDLCIKKQFYTPLLFNEPIGPREENIISRTDSFDLR